MTRLEFKFDSREASLIVEGSELEELNARFGSSSLHLPKLTKLDAVTVVALISTASFGDVNAITARKVLEGLGVDGDLVFETTKNQENQEKIDQVIEKVVKFYLNLRGDMKNYISFLQFAHTHVKINSNMENKGQNTILDLLFASISGKKKAVTLSQLERKGFAEVGSEIYEDNYSVDDDEQQAHLKTLRERLIKLYSGI